MWKKKIVFVRRVSPENARRLRAEFPGMRVVCCDLDHEKVKREIRAAHIVCGRITREEFLRAQRLELIYSVFVGVESLCFPELRDSPVPVTNGKGVYSHTMAEHIVAMALALYRNIPALVRAQQKRQWSQLPSGEFQVLEGKTVGLLGAGSIGMRAAKLFKAFDCRTLGYNVSGRRGRYLDRALTGDALPEFLAQSDIIVNTLPHTPATRRLIGTEQFRRMKRTAVFINAGRGKTVDEAALIAALKKGAIAGAGLDVFEEEPLPKSSPLWTLENVIISPHQSGDGPGIGERSFNVLLENLRRLRDGRPLLNLVNKSKGY